MPPNTEPRSPSPWATPPRSGGLYPSLWPADHGDTARRKSVLGGGLPASLDADRIELLENSALPNPQWMYTRGEDELFVYGAPSRLRDHGYFARVDATTLAVHQKMDLPWSLYLGGALIHANGDVYLVQGPQLFRFPAGDLSRPQRLRLPTTNGIFTQYNGLNVTHDGLLVLKGWSLTARDLGLFRARLITLTAFCALLGAAIGALFSGLVALLAIIVGATALPWVGLALKGSLSGVRWREFFAPRETGCLLLVDAESMTIRQQLTPPERLSYARSAVVPQGLEAERGTTAVQAEYVVIPGDEWIHRWRYVEGRLEHDAGWGEPYRRHGDGSFVGTGPAVFDQQVYYTNNTAPIGLVSCSYAAFRKGLDDTAPQQRVALSDGDVGFMFWSTVIDPLRRLGFVWDSAGAWVEARDLDSFQRRWRAPAFNADCCTLQAEHGHLYVTDHDRYLAPSQLMQSVARRPLWPNVRKDFVVLDASSGAMLLRVPLGAGSPSMSMIVPGFHQDVFVARRSALTRIVQRPAPSADRHSPAVHQP